MHQSTPDSLYLRNFGSIGPGGMTFIFKNGQIIGVTGENGVGKSTVMDGMRWLLIGKTNPSPVKDFVNWNAGKPAFGRLVWIGHCGTSYTIQRTFGTTGTVKVFENLDDGELRPIGGRSRVLDQFIQDKILGMSAALLDNLCLLNETRFKGFADMDAASFRKLIEASFNLGRIDDMLKKAKDAKKVAVKLADKRRDEMNTKKGRVEAAADVIKYIDGGDEDTSGMRRKVEEKRLSARTTLTTLAKERRRLRDAREKAEDAVRSFIAKKTPEDAEKAQTRQMEKSRAWAFEIEAAKKRLSFYTDNDDCPTCDQPLDESMVNNITQQLTIEITEAAKHQKRCQQIVVNVGKWLDAYDSLVSEVETIDAEMSQVQRYGKETKRSYDQLDEVLAEMDKSKPRPERPDIAIMEFELDEAEGDYADALSQCEHWRYLIEVILSDGGLKRQLLQKFIPDLQRFSNLILQDFAYDYLEIELDEDMKVSVKNEGETRPFERCSRGEKFRINVALLYGYITAIREFHNVRLPIHFLDEIFNGSLDKSGVEMFLEVVRKFATDNQVPVYIISHTLDQRVYDEEIVVTKPYKYSEYITRSD